MDYVVTPEHEHGHCAVTYSAQESVKMVICDEIAEAKGDQEWEVWLKKVFAALDTIGFFVAQRRQGEASGIPNVYRGSFNFCVRVTFKDEGPDAIIRFPQAGHSAFREEKVAQEVATIRILQERTTIPLPRLISWGSTAESPDQLGPFIISDFVPGIHLSQILRDPTEPNDKKDYLDPCVDEKKLNIIYDQLADYTLQMFKLNFHLIGAISNSKTLDECSFKRPLTYSMNELVTCAGYPDHELPTTPFESVKDYLNSLTHEHIVHLQTQRNAAHNPSRAEELYVARRLISKLTTKFCLNDSGPFKLFCDDLRPQNMLVDPDTLQITAILDLEFTNAMPAQFSCDPPWWLLLVGPDMWLQRGRTMEAFISAYEPRMRQFVRALEKAEAVSEPKEIQLGEKPLSCLMRESWETGMLWFNYAMRKPFDVDDLFNTFLNASGAGLESLDDEARAGLQPFIEMKMAQSDDYVIERLKLGL